MKSVPVSWRRMRIVRIGASTSSMNVDVVTVSFTFPSDNEFHAAIFRESPSPASPRRMTAL